MDTSNNRNYYTSGTGYEYEIYLLAQGGGLWVVTYRDGDEATGYKVEHPPMSFSEATAQYEIYEARIKKEAKAKQIKAQKDKNQW